MRKLLRMGRALSGIYGTGFRNESVLGVLLPFAFVALVGGLGAVLVLVLD